MAASQLKLYNTLTRKKETFKPINPPNVGIYTCGPTVYWYQHIGNLKAFLFADFLKRVLSYNGYKVKHIINITDVGHLTSDSDTGEDKMEKAAKREGKKAEEIADYYFALFDKDLKKLNITEPNKWTKATEHVKEQIEMIKVMEKKGYTYKTNDGIYFDTSKLKDYGKLAKLKKEGLQAGKRISMGEKRNNTDFALWKFSDEPGVRQQEWQSPWGLGFPGWHIECSAMSLKYLGGKDGKFDIHTGGIDHIPIHHTNEIAQNYAYLGHDAVNYWLHENFLTLNGEKVSKSKGGLYTLSELEEKGYPSLAYRYLNLTARYSKKLEFSLEIMDSAKSSYERLKNIIKDINDDGKVNEKYLKEFERAINDDLNMPQALAVLWNLIRDERADGKIGAIKKIDEVFGLELLKKEKLSIPVEIKKLIDERETARKAKDWKLADKIRDKINREGYALEDTEKGVVVKKKNLP